MGTNQKCCSTHTSYYEQCIYSFELLAVFISSTKSTTTCWVCFEVHDFSLWFGVVKRNGYALASWCVPVGEWQVKNYTEKNSKQQNNTHLVYVLDRYASHNSNNTTFHRANTSETTLTHFTGYDTDISRNSSSGSNHGIGPCCHERRVINQHVAEQWNHH